MSQNFFCFPSPPTTAVVAAAACWAPLETGLPQLAMRTPDIKQENSFERILPDSSILPTVANARASLLMGRTHRMFVLELNCYHGRSLLEALRVKASNRAINKLIPVVAWIPPLLSFRLVTLEACTYEA